MAKEFRLDNGANLAKDTANNVDPAILAQDNADIAAFGSPVSARTRT